MNVARRVKQVVPTSLLCLLLAGLPALTTGCQSSSRQMSLNKPNEMAVPDYVKATADGYELAYDEGLIYNPISAEAKKTGTLNQYDGAPTRRAVINEPGLQAEFTMPTKLIPYSAVPIDYKITKTGAVDFPLSIVATAFEEPDRGSGSMFDLAVPGKVDIELKYLGSVTGTVKDGSRHIMAADNTDTPADAYPHYTTTELSSSGTVQSGDIVWLKFQYTNTGDTILDAEGIGGFVMEPRLLRRQMDGSYDDIGGLINQYIRELTYVYPGETREFWLNFTISSEAKNSPEGYGLSVGDYRVNFATYYRTETDYQPLTTMWAGYPMQTASFDFTVSDTAAQTAANPVKVTSSEGARAQNQRSWLHYFEEFMTTYEQYATDPGTDVLEGRIWVQPAAFTEQIVLKLIHNTPRTISRAAIPVTMDAEAMSITYNPENINVVVDDDGLAWPAVYGQPMTDMRVNVNTSPYPEESIVKDILTMKECGINLFTNQGWPYLYDITANNESINLVPGKLEWRSNIRGDAMKYTMDLYRRLGLKFDSMGGFYFGSAKQGDISKWITGTNYRYSMASPSEADYGDDRVAPSVAPMYLYQRERWGDLYWTDAAGLTEYPVEDTRGYLRYEMDGRMAIGTKGKQKFREWLTEKYKTVEAMNEAWGTNYKSIKEVDPEEGLTNQEVLGFMYLFDYNNAKTGFQEWSPAVIDLDVFRTQLRLKNYSDALADIRKQDPTAMFQLRTEGSNIVVPGLDPATTNAHYRNLIYNQLRNASIAELVAVSDTVRSYADYVVLPLTPTEVYDVVKKSVDNGLIPMLMPQFNNMRDFAINDKYGRDFQYEYNLEKPQKAAFVKALTALYPWWKATYEAGGVPGILWQDLGCDGVVTETQQKEMKFFKEKVEKMMSDPAVKKQAKMKQPEPAVKEGKYAYKPEFLDQMIQKFQQ